MLTDEQKDILKEHINVYIGQAASMLSEMASQKVLLSVPEIDLISLRGPEQPDWQQKLLFKHGHIVSSSMKFGHNFSGRAMLIFPARKAKLLVDACMGEFTGDEAPAAELLDTDFDVLREISNVILNSVIGEFGNLLDEKLEFSLPDVELVFVSEDEQKSYLQSDLHMLVLYTSFMLADAKVEGVVIIALGVSSYSMLIAKIDKIIGELT